MTNSGFVAVSTAYNNNHGRKRPWEPRGLILSALRISPLGSHGLFLPWLLLYAVLTATKPLLVIHP